jgi:predicted DNA-binding protein
VAIYRLLVRQRIIRMPDELWEELKRLATGKPVSELIRQIAAEFVKRQKAKKKP